MIKTKLTDRKLIIISWISAIIVTLNGKVRSICKQLTINGVILEVFLYFIGIGQISRELNYGINASVFIDLVVLLSLEVVAFYAMISNAKS